MLSFSNFILFITIIFYTQSSHVNCTSYATLNLSEWLESFENCDVKIMVARGEQEFDIGRFNYPVSLFNLNPQRSFPKITFNLLRKNSFCAVQGFVVPLDWLLMLEMRDILYIFNAFCSKPAFGLLEPVTHASGQYKWTSCLLLLIIPDYVNESVKIRTKIAHKLRYMLSDEKRRIKAHSIQYFIFKYNKGDTTRPSMLDTNYKISTIEYVCQQCFVGQDGRLTEHTALVSWPVICPCPNCRPEMEKLVEQKIREEKDIISTVQSSIPPFENLESKVSRGPTRSLILPQNQAFHGLKSMTVRQYYFGYRHRINFIRMIQSILFENVSHNISSLLKFTNVGLHDYDPTSKSQKRNWEEKGSDQFVSRRIHDIVYGAVDELSYGFTTGNAYVTGETYFDFLTCHGLKNRALLTVYLQPFDFSIWLAGFSALLCLVAALTANNFRFFLANGKNSHYILLKSAVSSSTYFCLSSISILLENSFGQFYLPGVGKPVAKIAYLVLAFMCILLGSLYKSIITTDMITPVIGTIPYDNWSQLMSSNFTLVAIPPKWSRRAGSWSNDSIDSVNGKVLRKLVGESISYLPRYLDNLLALYIYDLIEMTDEDIKKDELFYSNIIKSIQVFVREEDALDVLASCEKNAFVGSVEEIADFLEFNRNRVSFGKGKEKFLSHGLIWRIPHLSGGYIHRRMSLLISSGVYKVWERAFYAKTRDELDISLKKAIMRTSKQSMDEKLGTLFKIVLLALSFCIVLLCIEVLLSKSYKVSKTTLSTMKLPIPSRLRVFRYTILAKEKIRGKAIKCLERNNLVKVNI
jgi:hypothetical protein